MKKYHLYTIGNALLDINFDISPELLAQHNLTKGTMTLIEAEQAQHLVKNLAHLSRTMSCAGSGVNTTIMFAQLGGKAFYSGRVGNDQLSETFYRSLLEHNIHTNIPRQQKRPNEVTGTCLVMVTPDAERTMTTHVGAARKLTEQNIDLQAIADAEYLYIEGYTIESDSAFAAVLKACAEAKKHRTKIALALSDPYFAKTFRDRFMEIINHGIDLLFCNEIEAQIFTQTDDMKAAARLLHQHAKVVIITLGEKGSLIYTDEALIQTPAHPTNPLDAVGAGDGFAGSFMYCLTHGYSLQQAAQIANYAASLIVEKYGPRLTEVEIAQIKHKLL